jgi:hypothetical protein
MKDDFELYKEYLKDWVELYPYFCWHKGENTKAITDEVLFKKEFTFERWKQGFHEYNTMTNLGYKLTDELHGVKKKNLSCRLRYNIFRFIPFNIKYEIA